MADKKLIHRLFLIKGKLKPACEPDDPGIWLHPRRGMPVTCRLCLSGRKRVDAQGLDSADRGVLEVRDIGSFCASRAARAKRG